MEAEEPCLSPTSNMHDGVPPDIISTTTCGSSSTTCSVSNEDDDDDDDDALESSPLERSLDESHVQVEFAERTAHEMNEWVCFWESYVSNPQPTTLAHSHLPKNSLEWDDIEEDCSTKDDIDSEWEVSTACQLDSPSDDDGCTPSLFLTPIRRPRYRFQDLVKDVASIPPIVPCTPDSLYGNDYDDNDSCITTIKMHHEDTDGDCDETYRTMRARQIYSSHLGDDITIVLREDTDTIARSCSTPTSTTNCTFPTTEDLHVQARVQRDQLENIVSGRLRWMEECLISLQRHEWKDDEQPSIEESSSPSSLSSSSSSSSRDALPGLRVCDLVYLWTVSRAKHGADLAYIVFCRMLPFECLSCWIWCYKYTSPRIRRFLFSVVLLGLVTLVVQLFLVPPLQPPRPRRFVDGACATTMYPDFSFTTSTTTTLDSMALVLL